VLQYFEKILLLLNSLWCSLQDELNIILLVVALVGAFDTIQNDHQNGHHLGFYSKLGAVKKGQKFLLPDM